MGLFSFIRNQLIDVIEWLDDSNNTLVWRFPDSDNEIKMGAKLTVREGQTAIFVNEGQIADVFPPGLYSLSTQNMPILTTLKSWKYGFNSPFKAEVYFLNMRQYLDLKWGTQNPIMMRDAEFGVVRLRAFGVYAIRVKDPARFFREVVGTDGHFTKEEIEGQLRRTLVSAFTTMVGKANIPAIDLAGQYDVLAAKARTAMQPEFESLGLELTKLIVENISLPPDVETALDRRSTMGVLGDVGRYAQFQAADAMREAARQPGGLAGAGVGMGAGMMLGQVFGQAMGQMAQPQAPAAPAAAPAAPTVPCASCGAQVRAGAKFCPECGQKVVPAGSTPCVRCGAALAAGAKFCPECGSPQQAQCPACKAAIKPDAKFCPECGQKLG